MPINKNSDLRSNLFDLLLIKMATKEDFEKELDKAILRQKSMMDKEDISFVEEQISKLK